MSRRNGAVLGLSYRPTDEWTVDFKQSQKSSAVKISEERKKKRNYTTVNVSVAVIELITN